MEMAPVRRAVRRICTQELTAGIPGAITVAEAMSDFALAGRWELRRAGVRGGEPGLIEVVGTPVAEPDPVLPG
jgi:hypothetical protein